MKAAHLLAPEKIEATEINEPFIGKYDVLIRPQRAGICGTDIHNRGNICSSEDRIGIDMPPF